MNQVFNLRLLFTAGLLLPFPCGVLPVRAGISYSVAGSTYTENFDSLPGAPANASIETVYANGWQDDAAVVAGDHVGVPGWYLRHPLGPLPEGGTSGYQRIRFGSGSATTGSFWAFRRDVSDPDAALGSVGSLVLAGDNGPIYRAVQLINSTGITLTSFTVSYDGEQWRDGASATGETQIFEYSLTATAADWYSTAAFVAVPELNFTSPVVADAGTGAAVDGNAAGRLQDITATITNISWAPGAELWLRWNDPQLGGGLADDGLAIDNVQFTATAPPALPDAKLTFSRTGGGALQLEWQGAGATVSYQVQHSPDLQTWTSAADPAAEISGPMTWLIPVEQLAAGRRYFRLRRVMTP